MASDGWELPEFDAASSRNPCAAKDGPLCFCVFFALNAAFLGVGGFAGSFVGVAKILFIVLLVFAILSFVEGGMRRGRFWG